MDIHDNEIHFAQSTQQNASSLAGISIGDPQNPSQSELDDIRVFGNRITDFGAGISCQVAAGNVMVKSNQLERLGTGIVFAVASTGALSIENNQISDISGLAAGGAGLVFGIMVGGAGNVQIRDNSLMRLGTTGSGTIYAEAIYVISCNEIAIDGNTIVDLAPQNGFKGAAIGIGIQYPFTDAAVRDNQIRRSSSATPTADSALWAAIGITGSAPANVSFSQNATDLKAGKRVAKKAPPRKMAMAMTPTQSMLAKVPQLLDTLKLPIQFATMEPGAAAVPAQRALMRGNQVNGYGNNTMIEAQGLTDCDCSGNQCLTLLTPGVESSMADVMLAAMALAVNGNRVQGSSFSISLSTPNKVAAVIGNVTTGRIQLDGSALPAPWSTLNVTGI
jgi:hypothetical protein